LLDLRKPRAVASGAFLFWCFPYRLLHKIIFLKWTSNQIRPCALYQTHVIMQNGLLTAIVPFDGYACPIRFGYGATVGLIVSPANAVASF
jgi:hypothetical protein